MCTLKDFFDAADKINQTLPEVYNSGEYMFVSLDVISLFTNLLLKKTVDIILKRIYTSKEITTILTKRSLEKLILEPCQKTTLLINDKICERTDAACMTGYLGPALAKNIMAVCQKVIVNHLIENNIVKLYIRCVGATLQERP